MRNRTESLDQWWERHDELLKNATEHHIRVFIRSRTPVIGTHDLRRDLIEKLDQGVADNHIGSYDVTAVGGDICMCETCQRLGSENDPRETILELVQWRDGGIQSTGFTRREVESAITNEQYETISPPETTLAIYMDGSLTGVFPCMADGVNHCPEAYLKGVLTGNRKRMTEHLANGD